MLEIGALTIFLLSFAGMAVIVIRKLPAMKKLPQTDSSGIGIKDLASKTTSELKKIGLAKKVSPERLLHKTLSKVRVLTLKTDHTTSNWLQRLREKSNKRKFGAKDNYWEEVKKLTKK